MNKAEFRDKYKRLLRRGETSEAQKLYRERHGEEEKNDEEEVEEESAEHMVYTELNGVGEELAEEMFEAFGSYESFVEEASVESLSDISGIGESRAKSLLEQIEKE